MPNQQVSAQPLYIQLLSSTYISHFMDVEKDIHKYTVTQTDCAKARTFVPAHDPLPNPTNLTVRYSYWTHNEPTSLYLPNLYNLVTNHVFLMYNNKCYNIIWTPANQLYPSKQPYSLIILQRITFEWIYHHNPALHKVKTKFIKVQLTQALENGHTRYFHGNIYTHRAEGYIEIFSIIKWVPAYVDNVNACVASKSHSHVTAKPIMVLPWKIPMDTEPIKIYNQANITPDTAFAHQNTSPNTTAIIYNIMADNTSDMAML